MEKIYIGSQSFADSFISKDHKRETILDKINKFINWDNWELILNNALGKKYNTAGRPSYPSIVMFKCLLLQRIYNLSDRQMEENLGDRLSFIRFCSLSLSDSIPDYTTICNFRNSLLKNEIVKQIFDELSEESSSIGFNSSNGITVDASVIDSSRHPNKIINTIPVDRDEPDLHTVN